MRRPDSRRTTVSSSMSNTITAAMARPQAGEHLVERRGLRVGAREAVEEHAGGGVAGGQPLAEHRDDEVVGDQVAAGHDGLGLEPERRPVAHGGAQHVAGGDVGQAAGHGHARSLGALTGARGAHQDQVECHRTT